MGLQPDLPKYFIKYQIIIDSSEHPPYETGIQQQSSVRGFTVTLTSTGDPSFP